MALKADLTLSVWMNVGHGKFVRERHSHTLGRFKAPIAQNREKEEPLSCCCSSRDGTTKFLIAVRSCCVASNELERCTGATRDDSVEELSLASTSVRGPPLILLS